MVVLRICEQPASCPLHCLHYHRKVEARNSTVPSWGGKGAFCFLLILNIYFVIYQLLSIQSANCALYISAN